MSNHNIIAGPLVRWCAGALVRWSAGALVRWCAGPLVPLVRWSVGPLVRWCAGPLVRWSAGALVRWCAGPLVRSLVQAASGLQFAPMRVFAKLTLTIAAVVSGTVVSSGRQVPAADQGAAGAWQKLIKLPTIASVLHTTAHPDDEHGGVLTLLSRGEGARVSLLTLTRGESGDNALGPELFDALGLIRTEELLVSDRYYGVDRQYFGTVVDYGFSKRLDETLEKWGLDHVLS